MKKLVIALLPFVIMGCKQKTANDYTRELPVEGGYNVRDLGGYAAADGKTVKWRTVIRSGDLDKLTEKDLEFFAGLPLRTIIDFRDSAEVAQAPDRLPASVEHDIRLPIRAGSIIDMQDVSSGGDTSHLLELGNRAFVTHFGDEYRQFFDILSNPDNTPLLFHCSAGKDRTGFAAAMFLASLGVDRQTIIDDYMLSAELLKDKYAAAVAKYPRLEPLMTVYPHYIEAAFNEIEQQYGSVDNYLTTELGVDIALMRKLYTE